MPFGDFKINVDVNNEASAQILYLNLCLPIGVLHNKHTFFLKLT